MRLVLCLLLWLLPSLAQAGAWTKPRGETAVTWSHEGGEDGWSGLYVEHGGPWGLTFGLDTGGHLAGGAMALYRGDLAGAEADGRVVAFVRAALPMPEGTPWVAAVEFGGGTDLDVAAELDPETPEIVSRESVPRLRLGLSVGRGLSTRLGDGWLNLDLRAEPGRDDTRLGLGATAGLRPRGWLAASISVFAETVEETELTLAPAVAVTVPRVGEIGVGARVKRDETRLFLGLTRRF
jgi:hypothetical protein